MRTLLYSQLLLFFLLPRLTLGQTDLGRDADGNMIAYRQPIPGSDVSIEMVPVPGGTLRLDHQPAVKIAPFWIGKYEMTNAQYGEFMSMHETFAEIEHKGIRAYLATEHDVDNVSAPTPVYDPPSRYEFSCRDDSPAPSMSQFAARQFTKWLSLLTENDYRLPVESEWKYACLAGGSPITRSALRKHAVLDYEIQGENGAGELVLKVGTKQANAWGIHDMHGNVAEFVIEDSVAKSDQPRREDWRTHRAYGGSFADFADEYRWDSFLTIDHDEWWEEDAHYPRSPTWMANISRQCTVGFRIVRPATPMTPAEKTMAWEADSDELAEAVKQRVGYGRDKRGKVDAHLPNVMRQNGIEAPDRSHAPWIPRKP